MGSRDVMELGLFVLILVLATKPLGLYLNRVFSGQKSFLSFLFSGVENFIYKVAGINPNEEQNWKSYLKSLLGFSLIAFLFTFFILLFQNKLPLNPQNFPGLSWHLALNTAISFLTNTNWQSYAGETTLSYFSQMVGLVFQNFVSAAVGIAIAVALIRGLARKEMGTLGNFWADLVRANLYILLPFSFLFAIFFISQGVIQNFLPYQQATTLEGVQQIIAQGPVASQVAIKMLGTNGGGFFNANAAHPFENPTALSNFVQMLLIFLIPSSLVYLLGKMTGNKKHAWSVWAVMLLLFIAGTVITAQAEYAGNPLFQKLGLDSKENWEGKETRFGIFDSALFATATTDASCGAVNAMHDSFTPLGGLVPLVNILLGEVVFGGVGAGLYGMMIFILLTVFIAGLMVGRTPEYLGKKIQAYEIKAVMVAVIVMAFSILGFAAWGVLDSRGLAGLSNSGPHGLSEIFYAYTSATGNNGSAFAGLSANTPFYNVTLGIAMLLGRFMVIIPMLAVAGSLSGKKIHPASQGSFPVHGIFFICLLVGIIILVGALTFFPALTLGPIVEHFEMMRGNLY